MLRFEVTSAPLWPTESRTTWTRISLLRSRIRSTRGCLESLVGFAVVGGRDDVVGAQEAVPFDAEVDKGRIEGWLDVGHDAAIDVAAAEAGVGGGHFVAVEGVAVDDGNAHLVGALGVDEHSSGHGISGLTADLEWIGVRYVFVIG